MTLVAAARAAHPEVRFEEADASSLPFPDQEFDCVVAFMSLQDFDDLEGAVCEAARVLASGGRFCIAVVHPISSAGRFAEDDADSPFVIEGSYLAPTRYADSVARDGLEMTFVSEHRPLCTYAAALESAGFLIERLTEPPMPEHAFVRDASHRWADRLPLFLHIRALKPQAA